MPTLTDAAKTDRTTERTTKLRIFDCDVHPVPKKGLTSLEPYLSKPWQERFARKQAMHDGLTVPIRFRHPNGSVVRQDARTPDGARRHQVPAFSSATYSTRTESKARC
jgi:hypothetical protein